MFEGAQGTLLDIDHGTIQHVSGISGADTIVAINNDPNAEIFQHANYGIVGDCMEVLNDMLAHLK